MKKTPTPRELWNTAPSLTKEELRKRMISHIKIQRSRYLGQIEELNQAIAQCDTQLNELEEQDGKC